MSFKEQIVVDCRGHLLGLNVKQFPFNAVTHRQLAHLLYQRAMQFVRGSEATKAIPKGDITMLRLNKRKLADDDRKNTSSLDKLMLEHLRQAMDFEHFYSMPQNIFDELPKQELKLGLVHFCFC
eukprot:Skav234990  [mRNA]  locus=scaffold122:243407:249816:+ [translate_table: standard]